MTRQRISSGSEFEEQIGYSRAVVAGSQVYVSGTTGFDYSTMTISPDLKRQTAQALRNVADALASAGCSMTDVVRVRYILPERDDFPTIWPQLREAFGAAAPAATMICAGLSDPRMRVEIEVDAVLDAGAR